MNTNKIKYLLVACFIVVCGFFWLFFDAGKLNRPAASADIFDSQEEAEQMEASPGETGDTIYIHIVGAVKKPGVYTFTKKPRVIEVVEAAGGFTGQAVRSGVNQAELVEDGVQIVIESKKEQREKKAARGQQEHSDKLDLNAASKEELMTLPGIGESKALAILSYRETKGKFQKIEDIMNISGIKTGVFDKIKDLIRV